jgi:hypothetical protein
MSPHGRDGLGAVARLTGSMFIEMLKMRSDGRRS